MEITDITGSSLQFNKEVTEIAKLHFCRCNIESNKTDRSQVERLNQVHDSIEIFNFEHFEIYKLKLNLKLML